MNILVTGVAGFIGSHTAEALLRRGDSVVGVDNFDPFYARSLKERNLDWVRQAGGAKFGFVEGDLAEPTVLDQLWQAAPFDVVVHLAAKAGVRPSIDDPASYVRSNLEATTLLLEKCRKTDHKRMVFASSSSVYGADSQAPFSELARCDRPVSPYAATKRAGELIAHTYAHLYGFDLTCLRFFTVYGPRQRPEMAIHKFATALWRGEPIAQFGDGGSSRDYTYVDDITAGVLAAIDRPQGLAVFNLGGDRETRLDELVKMLGKALNKPVVIERKPDAAGDVPRTCADLTLARRCLGYAPQTPIDRGIELFARWFEQFGVK
ncbi:MAG: NAD-dependent epimerase/dehydratase family protein [Myxococcales bacterium]|nr:NAD-dependent epimerase/dehydratase family protein [Myxococcales bacterium]